MGYSSFASLVLIPDPPCAYSCHSVVETAQGLEPYRPGFESWFSHSQAVRSWSSPFTPPGLFPPLENECDYLAHRVGVGIK